MSDFEEKLEQGWTNLSSAQAGTGVDTAEVDVDLPTGRLRVGVDGWGARHLLIPVGDEPVNDDRRSSGVLLVRQELRSASSESAAFADLVCTTPRLHDVFTALAADVCRSVVATPEAPGSVAAGVLERWRQLLSRASTEAEFTEATMIGVMGELVVLGQAAKAGGKEALDAWTGPQRLHHDFRRGDIAVEVKTTTSREGLRVTIHGLEQLDHSADVRLHLTVLRLILDPAGTTLPEMVDDLSGRVPSQQLLAALETTGYRHGQTDPPDGAPSWPRYLTTDQFLWEVGDDFPAIRGSALPAAAPAALESIRYVLNLAGAGEPLSPDDAEAVIDRLAEEA